METELKTDTLAERNRALLSLRGAGQSPWYDNIDRRLVKNGELKRLFGIGVLGVTSNPTIFEKAVSASDIYDAEIKKLSGEGKTAREIYDILTTEDVKAAAELLTETYRKSNCLDGYVSIEVLPEFAHDAEETIRNARALFKRINMPNIMIKVPGTAEGPEAVWALTKEGINVNVTLLFSVKQYEANALAYIEGLKDRLKDGKDINNIFSVASVFVSRIDTALDAIFAQIQNEEFKGKIAVYNSKMIYGRFKELFMKGNFKKLQSKDANIERLLWASTSTKNPAYSDLKYVEELIGPNTINTMPPATMDAFLDHGRVEKTIEKGLDEAKSCLAKLESLGIDIDNVFQEIQDAGIEAFQVSFDKLIHAIEKKL